MSDGALLQGQKPFIPENDWFERRILDEQQI
jgi:hypothetical protein